MVVAASVVLLCSSVADWTSAELSAEQPVQTLQPDASVGASVDASDNGETVSSASVVSGDDGQSPFAAASEGDVFLDPVSERGQAARGLYFSASAAGFLGARGLTRLVRSSNMDAVVIDLKDERGRVMHDTAIKVLQQQKSHYLGDVPRLVAQLREAGIYTIARIVCFSDPRLPRSHPERAVLDGRPKHKGELWANWGRRNTWLDPYNAANHRLIVELAGEAEKLGFDEIQLDYFRFPVDPAADFAVFPAQSDRPRHEVLAALLHDIDAAVRIPIGVDVFGITAFRWWKPKPNGLGQLVEKWVDHVEVLTPMLYVHSMRSWARDGTGKRAERLVALGVSNLRRRLGTGPVLRPFLQAFEKGADDYGPAFIAEQVRGARRGGADGFLFWHPGCRYRVVAMGMRGPGRYLAPFPIGWRMASRQQQSERNASGLAKSSPRTR